MGRGRARGPGTPLGEQGRNAALQYIVTHVLVAGIFPAVIHTEARKGAGRQKWTTAKSKRDDSDAESSDDEDNNRAGVENEDDDAEEGESWKVGLELQRDPIPTIGFRR